MKHRQLRIEGALTRIGSALDGETVTVAMSALTIVLEKTIEAMLSDGRGYVPEELKSILKPLHDFNAGNRQVYRYLDQESDSTAGQEGSDPV